jgi:hypothetical protein
MGKKKKFGAEERSVNDGVKGEKKRENGKGLCDFVKG